MSDRDRRDWSLLIFIVPIGILLMLVAGQFGMRIISQWILYAGMGSYLDIDTAGQGPIPLFNMQILTPFAWQNTYLTPDPGGFIFPPFIIIQPTMATPVPTTRPTERPGITATSVSIPTDATLSPPTATNYVPLPTTTPENPTSEPTNPAETPTNTPSPMNTATDTPTNTATNTPTNTPSTPPPGTPFPPVVPIGPPDGTPISIPPGYYTVLDITSSPIIVTDPSDTASELVYFELLYNIDRIHLDYVILGISISPTGGPYYQIFYWGDSVPDLNSNVNPFRIIGLPPSEVDNQPISINDLYPYPGTGVEIDVDNAPSAPPSVPGGYGYLVIISPSNAVDGSHIDSIQILP